MKKTPKITRTRKKPRSTIDAIEILDRMTGSDRGLRKMIAEETINAQVAEMIHEARTNAGLTQQELAKLIGTQQSVIARLEDADYEGHSLSMLQRIAEAVNRRLEIRMIPTHETLESA